MTHATPNLIDLRQAERQARQARAAPNGPIKEAVELDGTLTQDGIARVFARRFADRLRFCHHAGAWYEWSGTHWRRDETDLAFAFVRAIGREFSEGAKERDIKEVRRVTFAAGVERFSRSDPIFAVTSAIWDSDPLLLGTPGGTVDLRTGAMRAPDQGDHITKLTAVAPADTSDCPRWRRFLAETFGEDAETVRFVQQWCGYCLTGDTREHALVFGYGAGGNGKSVFINTITGIAADYAVTAAMETFTASGSDRHPTDLAMLRGARMVTASETEEGRHWAESRIKQLTGGDRITARFMRQDFFTFKPAFKLLIVGNHKPLLRNVDDAARRRFNLVPFTRKPASPDPLLEEKLRAEWPGILRWMIDGCRDWEQFGLMRPASVTVATASYFDDQDLFGQWLAEDCDAEIGNSHKFEATSLLFASWSRYADKAGEKPGSVKAFAGELAKRGFERCTVGHQNVRAFRGLRLRPQAGREAGGG